MMYQPKHLDAGLLRALRTIERLVPDNNLPTAERACHELLAIGYRDGLQEASSVLRYFTERHEMPDERRQGFAQALDLLEGMYK